MDAPNNQSQQAGQHPAPAGPPGSQPPQLTVPPLVVPSIGAAPALPPQMAAIQGMPPGMNMFPANMAQFTRPALTPQQQQLQAHNAAMAQQQHQHRQLQNHALTMAQQQQQRQQQLHHQHQLLQQQQIQQQQASRAPSGSAPNSSMPQPVPMPTQGASAPAAAPAAASRAGSGGLPVPPLENINIILDQHIPGLGPQLPPGQQIFQWQLPNANIATVPREFFEKYRGVWKAYHAKDPRYAQYLSHAYTFWMQRITSKSTAAAAGGAIRPQTAQANAAPRPPVKPRVQQADVQERGKASTAELQKKRDAQKQEGSAALAGAFPSIVAPRNGEEQAFLPLPRLRSLVKETCGPTAKLTPEGEGAMKALADDFVSGAIGFAVDMAKRKKARKLDPADLALYFKRTWNIDVPGLNQGQVTQYRRITPSDAHRARLAAVRKANMTSTGGGGSGRAAGNRGGGATPAQSPAAGGSVGISVSPAAAAAAAAAERKGKAPMREAVQMEDGGGDDDEDMPDVF